MKLRLGGVYFLRDSNEDECRFVMAIAPVDNTLDAVWHGTVVDILIQPAKVVLFDPLIAEEIGVSNSKEERQTVMFDRSGDPKAHR